MHLRWEDVDLSEGFIQFRSGVEGHRTKSGRPGARRARGSSHFRTAFDTAAKAAKIPDAFHRHDLRHRRVTTWLAAGANPVHVKEAMGNSDLRTTMGYTHLSKKNLRSLVEHSAPNPTVTERLA